MKKPKVFKIIVFGESGVGKTTLLSKCFKEADNESLGVPPKLTLGVSFYKDTIEVDGETFILHIWELTGNPKFKDLIIDKTKREGKLKKPRLLFESFTLGAAAAIFVYDITNKSSLGDLDKWLAIYRSSRLNRRTPILMIGNKLDLQEKREIKTKNANKLALSKDLIGAIEISALTDDKVKKLFTNFTRIINSRNLVDVFKSTLDLRIVILLKIYKELSLKEMVYHMGKNKATFSRHTKELLKLHLLESYSKEDEIQPGNIKRKYYKLSQNFDELLKKKEFDLGKAIKENNWEPLLANLPRFSYEYKKIKMIADYLNNFIEATENQILTSVAMEELPLIETIDLLMQVLDTNLINYRFISEDQLEQVKTLSSEFHSKLEEILKNDDRPVKPYLYMDILMPIITIAKLGVKSDLFLMGLGQQAKETQNEIHI